MSFEKATDGFQFCCDVPSCGETWDPPKLGRGSAPRDFHDSLARAKADGWRAVQVPGRRGPEWEHFCPYHSGGPR